jgi:thymidylate synthase
VQWREWPAYRRVKLYSPEYNAALAECYHTVGMLNVADQGIAFNCAVVYKPLDLLGDCLRTIVNNPGDRRILFHAWNPADLDAMALPPCHLLYQFHPNPMTKQLSMSMYVRSNDLGLGTPFNIAEGAALLALVSCLTGYDARWLSYTIGDAHIYENHIPQLEELLTRTPLPAPKLVIDQRVPRFADTGVLDLDWLMKVEPSDFQLEGYQHHGALPMSMAV